VGAAVRVDLAAACAPAAAQESGFTCCTFHHDGDWISDANWFIHPKIPPGTPIRIVSYGDWHANVDIGGRRMSLGLDYGRKQNLRSWAKLMIVAEDPKERIDAWPASVQEAVKAGKVALGMTKEQVIAALGYPPAHATPSLNAVQWKYWYSTHGTYLVSWDETGQVSEVRGSEPQIRRAVLVAIDEEPARAQDVTPAQLKDLEGLLPGK
jgi:outer membrane protein assembly factor BamE (lipoprotein component of BamABCDE complex)